MKLSKADSRSQARKIYKEMKGDIPKGYHIHHIDGNPFNNLIDNLLCVDATNHWIIHYLQGDKVALYGKFVQGASEAGKIGGSKYKPFGTDNPFYGKKHTEEVLDKHFRGKNASRWKGWYITPKGRFASSTEAAKANDMPRSTVYVYCKVKSKQGWDFEPKTKTVG